MWEWRKAPIFCTREHENTMASEHGARPTPQRLHPSTGPMTFTAALRGEDLGGEDLRREDLRREDLRREDPQREDLQREDLQKEDLVGFEPVTFSSRG